MKSADVKLAYLLVASPVPNVYVGGLMVTDSRGLPLEFRYTEPIQPTKIQQVLYGQVLSHYIKREVILETLIKSIDSTFQCLLVEDEQLLDYPAKGYDILRISTTKASPLGAPGESQELGPNERMLQVTAQGSPIRLMQAARPQRNSSPSTTDSPSSTEANTPETASPVATRTDSTAMALLLQVGQTMDLVEPLKRIEKALEIICQEVGITPTAPAK